MNSSIWCSEIKKSHVTFHFIPLSLSSILFSLINSSPMENSKPLATESFSYSWLVDKQPHSSHKPNEKHHSFDFDVPFTSSSHVSLVHADEIFSDGHIMPIYLQTSLKSSKSVPPSPVSSYSLGSDPFVCNKRRCTNFLIGKWRKSSKNILRKCFGLVKPLYRTVGWSRKSNRVDDLQRKVYEVRSWSNSVEASPPRPSSVVVDHLYASNYRDDHDFLSKEAKSWRCSSQASPRISPSRSGNAWCVDESSIHEAILYCKRSIEK